MNEERLEGRWPEGVDPRPVIELDTFRAMIREKGRELYRDLPWRRTRDPYEIWVSEVMLQQTQVSRVDGRWQRWLERFPTVVDLAQAQQADGLAEWQGMGYNRRALSLLRCARIIREAGAFPTSQRDLVALPGIGPATAAGIRAFAFDEPGIYLETNVRTVFLHELFPQEDAVSDRFLAPLVEAACPAHDVRSWYYALLDYGAWLKRIVPNPSRRSREHVRQTSFEGSHRQKRAMVLRLVLDARMQGIDTSLVAEALSREEEQSGRPRVTTDVAHDLLCELAREGFCQERSGRWYA